MFDIEKVEVTESTVITSHETSYFTKPGVENVLNAAKQYHINLHLKKEVVLQRESLDRIFNMVNLQSHSRNQYIEILLISYSDASEEEEYITTTIQEKINILAQKDKQKNDDQRIFEYITQQEKSNKMPRIHIDYLNGFLESIDLFIMLESLPQSIIELYEVCLINKKYSLIKKADYIKLLTSMKNEDWNSGRNISTVDWFKNRIEIKNDKEFNLNDQARYWIVILDSEGNEAIVNANKFKELFNKSKAQYFIIEDYDGNKRKINKYSKYNQNKPLFKADNNTNYDTNNKKSILQSNIKPDIVLQELEPQFKPESNSEINDEGFLSTNAKEIKEEENVIEETDFNQPMKPQLKSKKRKMISENTNGNNINGNNGLINKYYEVFESDGKKNFIPLSILHKFIYKISIKEKLPLRDDIIDNNGKLITICPNDVTNSYLCRYYIEDIDPVTPKYHQVIDINTNNKDLISKEENDQCKSLKSNEKLQLKNLNGVEITIEGNDNDMNNNKWIKTYDTNDRNMYIQDDAFMSHLTKPNEIKNKTEFIDINSENRQMDIMNYLAYLYFLSHTELLESLKSKNIRFDSKDKNKVGNIDNDNKTKRALKSKKRNLQTNNEEGIETNNMTIYTDIKDKNKNIHINKANDVLASSLDNKENTLIDLNNESFTPNPNEIEFFNKDNELHQLFKVCNDKNEDVYIPKPYIISLLDNIIQSEANTPPIIQVHDYKLHQNNIPLKNLLSFLPLIPYYEQKIKTRQISRKTNRPKLTQNELIEKDTTDDQVMNLLDFLTSQSIGNETIKHNINLGKEIIDKEHSLSRYKYKYKTKRDYPNYPYSFIYNDTNTYYEVPNFLINQKEIKSRQEIIILLEKINQTFEINDYILVTILDDNNYNNEYIEIEDIQQSKFLTKKVYLMKYIKKLISNEPLDRYGYIEDNNCNLIQIDIHETLMKFFVCTPSPYMKDEVLIDINNTLYESLTSFSSLNTPPQYLYYEESTYIMPKTDLFEYMIIKDINEIKFIVRKPFVRSLLYTQNRLINVPIRDSANQIRLVSPIAVIGPKFSNMIRYNEQKQTKGMINDINIYINVRDLSNASRLITKKSFDDFCKLYLERKIKKDEVFTIIDRKNQRFQSTLMNMLPKNKKVRQWVLVEDVNNVKCLIYKNLLLNIITREYHEKDEYSIIDIQNKERLINPWLIKLKLKNEYEKLSNRDPAMLP